MENSLKRLRKAAGYKSAKAFAEAIGMPQTTYSKYEQSADSGEISMPLRSAWAIADALGCSIDALVGREEVPNVGMRGDMQRRYDTLSDDGKELVDELIAVVEGREKHAEAVRLAGLAKRYKRDARRYELMLLESAEAGNGVSDELVLFGSEEELHDAYEVFAAAKVTESEQRRIDHECDLKARLIERKGRFYRDDPIDPKGDLIRVGDDDYEAALREKLEAYRRELEEKAAIRVEEVMEGIMAAYDSMHPETRKPVSETSG